jgi:hypothetical protein
VKLAARMGEPAAIRWFGGAARLAYIPKLAKALDISVPSLALRDQILDRFENDVSGIPILAALDGRFELRRQAARKSGPRQRPQTVAFSGPQPKAPGFARGS